MLSMERCLLNCRVQCESSWRFVRSPCRSRVAFGPRIYGFELDDPPAQMPDPLVRRVMPDALPGRREIVVQSWLAEAGYPGSDRSTRTDPVGPAKYCAMGIFDS